MDDPTLVSFLTQLTGIIVQKSLLDSDRWDLNIKSYCLKPIPLPSKPMQSLLEDFPRDSLFGNLWLHLTFLFLFGKHIMEYFYQR